MLSHSGQLKPPHPRSRSSYFASLAAVFLLCFGRTEAARAAIDLSKLPAPANRPIDFKKDVAPVFEESCLRCHNAEKAKGKFALDTREHALKGGDNGVDIFPGDSAKSPLIHFVARLVEDSEMPPNEKGKPLSATTVGILRAWIDQGANWPSDLTLRDNSESTTPAKAEVFPVASLPPAASGKIDFVRDVQPIFSARCLECHGPSKQEAQFRLDSREIALGGGELGTAIIPGNGAASLLVQSVSGLKPDFVMPKKG